MDTKQILLENLTKIHTTEMGEDRIRRNLHLENMEIVEYCRKLILNKNSVVYKNGKNYYCEIANIIITINASSYTIITAHKIKTR